MIMKKKEFIMFITKESIRMSANKISLAVLSLSLLAAANAQAQTMSLPGSNYDACIEEAAGSDKKMQACTDKETDLLMKTVENKYETLANAGYFKNWNQGSGMFSGNFRTLLYQWQQYRNKYCSLYGYAISSNGTLGELSSSECMLELTKRQNKDLDVIIQNYKGNE